MDIFETFSESLNGRIGTFTASLPIMRCRRSCGIGRVGSVWYPILKAVLEPQFEVPMAQINRVAPFLGFIFGTPFSGPAFEGIFGLELASQAFFSLGQLHPARKYFGQHG